MIDQTSISDTDRYNAVCDKAASDPMFFDIFRRHPVYMEIVETLQPEAGLEYIKIALQKSPGFAARMDEFRRNDEVGAPLTAHYSKIGPFSPTTLRYVKIAADLQEMFGSLDGASIAEIGVGYGGQCRILSCLHAFRSYALFDLPPALRLAQRYLACFGTANVHASQCPPDGMPFDLVISNYALSEIGKEVQDAYISSVLAQSKHGYLIYNQQAFAASFPGYSYTAEELAERLPGAQITRGQPALAQADAMYDNCLIHW
jgi:putative sugar O-methyltransferase